jgi:hypothetical protein
MEETQFPDPKYARLRQAKNRHLHSENRENLAIRLSGNYPFYIVLLK